MKRLIAVILAGAALAGCVFQNMDDGLKALIGQDVHVAVARLGYPTDKREMLGDTIYIWSTAQTVTGTMPVTSTTTGRVGNVPVQSTTTNFVPTANTYACAIQMAVDSSERIKSYQWQGNIGGCQGYARNLKP
jgi:hypothetical protein